MCVCVGHTLGTLWEGLYSNVAVLCLIDAGGARLQARRDIESGREFMLGHVSIVAMSMLSMP